RPAARGGLGHARRKRRGDGVAPRTYNRGPRAVEPVEREWFAMFVIVTQFEAALHATRFVPFGTGFVRRDATFGPSDQFIPRAIGLLVVERRMGGWRFTGNRRPRIDRRAQIGR